MKNERNLLFDIFVVFLVSVFSLGFISCKNEVVEEDRLVDVSFAADDGSSRAVSLEMTEIFNPEVCWWIYTAEKISGVHTTGESKKDGSGNLIWRPVRNDECGLSCFTNQFSEGKWKFTVEGYHTQTASENRTGGELIFDGTAEVVLTKSTTEPNKPVSVIFELSDYMASKTYADSYTGVMIRDISFRVPEGVAWKSGDKVEISSVFLDNFTTVLDIGGTLTLTLNKNYAVGEVITVPCQIPKSVSAGQHYLGFCVKHYNGSSFSDSTDRLTRFFVISVPIYVRKGYVTFVSGEYELNPMRLMGGRVFYIDGTSVTGQAGGKMIVDGKAYWFGTSTGASTSYNLSGITAKGAVTDTNFKNNIRSYVCFGAETGKDQMYVVDETWAPMHYANSRGFGGPSTAGSCAGTAVGTGKSNWAEYKWLGVAARCGYFASQSGEHNGFTDWYLGSKDEVLGLRSSGVFTSAGEVWTSSNNITGAKIYIVNMATGACSDKETHGNSGGPDYAFIPIRSF